MSCFRSKTEAHKQSTRWPKRHKPHILHLDSLASLSTSPSLSLSPLATRSFDELTASSSPTIVCSLTPSSPEMHASLRSLLLSISPLLWSLSPSIPRDQDKIPTSPPLVFTGVSCHRFRHWRLRFPLLLFVFFLRHLNKVLTFDFNFFSTSCLDESVVALWLSNGKAT